MDLTTALDVPGRVWTSTLSDERRAIGLPTDGAVGGSAVVLARGASFSTQFAGGGIFKIRQRGSVPVFSLNGYGVSYDSITDPDSEWVTRWVVIPQAGGVFSIAANSYDAEFDGAVWLPTPTTFAEIFGLPEQTVTTGGEGTWKADLNLAMSRFEARASLTHATPTAWVEMNLTGTAKAVIGYQANGRGVLEFLLDGEALWDTTVSENNEVTLDIPAGQHVVRCLARNVSGSEGYAFTPVIRGVKVVADEHAGDISDALDYPSRWVHSGEWEKVVTPVHEGAAALSPVVPEGALGAVSPWLGTTVTGPGFLTFWMSNPDELAATLTMHGATLTGGFPEIRSIEAGWLEHRQWFPDGKHMVQLSLTGSREMMGRTFLDGMSFYPSAPAALESVSTGGPVVWEN